MGMGMFSLTISSGISSGLPLTNILLSDEGTVADTDDVQTAEAFAVGYGIDNSGTKSDYTIFGLTYSTTLNVYNFINERIIFRLNSSWEIDLPFCEKNNIRLMFSNYTGLSGSVSNYPQVQAVLPMGSNSHVQIYLTPDVIPNCVTCGASSNGTSNTTGYGNGLEFFDIYDSTESHCHAYIAGKLLYIKEQRSIAAGYEVSWWSCRYAARMTASNSGVWDINNGYGIIDVEAAIAYSGEIIEDPYL